MDAAIARWDALLSAEVSPEFCADLAREMRVRKLTFGDRLNCPFLRPFFLSASDESRIREAAEAIARLGERVVQAALASRDVFDQLGLTDAEARIVAIDPGYQTASTASRLDAFLLPDSLHFAEYNAESPAGPGYTQRLCELFDTLPMMPKFRDGRAVRFYRPVEALLDALIASYREWGGRAAPPTMAIVDWREVPTWSEFEILCDAFTALGVPTLVCDPRDLTFDGRKLRAGDRTIDLVYRRVLTSDIVARPAECEPLVSAYGVCAACVANTLRCKLAHKKAFFAVLTDPRNESMFSPAEQRVIRAHVPWTRVLAQVRTDRRGRAEDLPELALRERDHLVLKPNDEYGGKGVVLGWETTDGAWRQAIDAALADPPASWIVQERIPVRREVFPQFDADGRVEMRNMLVDLAPYLFRGRLAGYLTRLSSSGLANVTSGGGQVPPFVVSE